MTAILVEQEQVERDYGMRGNNAIVEDNGNRYLICDAFGGIDTLRGGAVRWDHGIVIHLQASDSFASLRATPWNDETTLWQAVLHGCDDSRPVLEDRSARNMAKAAGLL